MKNKLLAAAAVLAASLALIIGVQASNTVPENSVSLVCEKTDLETGDTLQVSVYSDREHTGTGAVELHISYDPDILELQAEECAPGTAVSGNKTLELTEVSRDDRQYICITALTDSLSSNRAMRVSEGNIYTLEFRVKDDFTEEAATDIVIEREVFEDVSGKAVELNDGSGVSLKINMIEYADYTAVDAALETVPENLSVYTEDSVAAVNAAVEAVVRDKLLEEQDDVDQMAADIVSAVEGLELRPYSDLFAVRNGEEEITCITSAKDMYSTYGDDGAVTATYPLFTVALPSGVETVEISFTDGVYADSVTGDEGGYISSINGGEAVTAGEWYEAAVDDAPVSGGDPDGRPDFIQISAPTEDGEDSVILYAITFSYGADYSAVDAALAQVPEDLSGYTEETVSVLNDAIAAVERDLPSEDQDRVDAMAQAILDAIDGLEERDQVVEFVTRLYRVCLDREPDEGGLNDWVSRLKSGAITGIKAARGFIFSKEFKGKNYCDEHYVEYLYRAFMGREYDEGGKQTWMNALAKGRTREAVFNGFARSQEFKQLCADYGIVWGDKIDVPEYGTIPGGPCSICGKEDAVMAFVKRLYNVCLDRAPDQSGLSKKTTQLKKGTQTAKQIAKSFYFSSEFKKKYPENRDFIIRLYKGLLGRTKDPSQNEVNTWINRMNNGLTREEVFNRFCASNEFTKLCAKYGVTPK
ncbi:MAG: DUF4214 domain-containing protein [Lachnospiraceae bacterium]|nr:DUF4214 domain-containing protein [Lachnospiraceae bacterium]